MENDDVVHQEPEMKFKNNAIYHLVLNSETMKLRQCDHSTKKTLPPTAKSIERMCIFFLRNKSCVYLSCRQCVRHGIQKLDQEGGK